MSCHHKIKRPAQEFNELNVRAPLVWGVAAAVVCLSLGIGAASLVPVERGIVMAAAPVVEARTEAIRAPRNGTIAHVNVVDGQMVRAGDVLVSFDTRVLDEQIAALKAQSEAARRQLELTRLEAVTVGDLLKRKLAAKANVEALERQVAEIDREAADLMGRIAATEQELERSSVRAPADGRVVSVRASGPGDVVQTGMTLLELEPERTALMVEGRLSYDEAQLVRVGMPARLLLPVGGSLGRTAVAGRLAWISSQATTDEQSGRTYFAARVEVQGPRVGLNLNHQAGGEQTIHVDLVTASGTLLQSITDPVARTLRATFRI